MPLISCPDCGTEVSDRAPACPRCGAPIAAPAAPAAPPPIAPPSLSPAERVFLQEGHVSVSSARFVVGAQTYPMANVSSVKAFASPPNVTLQVLMLLAAIVWTISILARSAWGELFFSVALLVLGIVLLKVAKTTHPVALTTSAGEVRPVSAYDKAYIDRIVAALNQAVVSRG